MYTLGIASQTAGPNMPNFEGTRCRYPRGDIGLKKHYYRYYTQSLFWNLCIYQLVETHTIQLVKLR